jgi:hypothetical protein
MECAKAMTLTIIIAIHNSNHLKPIKGSKRLKRNMILPLADKDFKVSKKAKIMIYLLEPHTNSKPNKIIINIKLLQLLETIILRNQFQSIVLIEVL